VAIIPLNFYAAYVHPAPGLEDKPYRIVANIVGGHILLSFLLGTALGYLFCWAFDRRERFWLWFNTGNWMTVPVTAVSIPILLLAVFGHHDKGDIERALTIVLYYGVLVNACVAWKAFKVDWTLAGFFACMSIFVAQQVWNFMFWVNDVPIKWYG
ncbi:MAG TPA: hypothetical protein VEF76_13010, partial [Patescibacteria group bacterium]|nr:hypothetical protein [Patescibacteria group bacterium]